MQASGGGDSGDAWEVGPERIGRSDLQIGPRVRRLRRFWRLVPSSPRCKMCYSPFGAPGGPVLRLIGKGRWPGNPKFCGGCFKDLYQHRQGAEIECSLLFADIRGSTALAESMGAAEFRGLLDRFYDAAMAVLIEHEAVVDKFVGDEVIGIFIPGLTGPEHARGAIDAGLELLRAMGEGADAQRAPIGIGVNSGVAYVGVVGIPEHLEFTALGDPVNVTARLASAAGGGELLVTDAAATAAGLATNGLERRRLELRGRAQAADVFVVRTVRAGHASV
jgi:adenylate cyclase